MSAGPATLIVTGSAATFLAFVAAPIAGGLSAAHAVLMTAGWVGFPSVARSLLLLGRKKLHSALQAVGLLCTLLGLGCKCVQRGMEVTPHHGSDYALARLTHVWVGWACVVSICALTPCMIKMGRSGKKIAFVENASRSVLVAAVFDLLVALSFSSINDGIKLLMGVSVVLSLVLNLVLKPLETNLDEALLQHE
mmetsp:Transcript_65736/g.182201  ORF Transcript_65736/g.182201 Transcript_65736/m.182201 type:complete len:194 (+) Transcript_65736:46-627(+)